MDWQQLLNSYLFDIICYVVGLVFGIVFLFIIFKLALAINKQINKKRSKIVKDIQLVTIEEVEETIKLACDNYLLNYGNKKISLRFKATKNISLSLIEDIAKMYYPDSKQPLAEISIKELIILYEDINHKLVIFSNDLFDSTGFKIAFQTYKLSHNTINFFRKQNNTISEKNIRKMKISTIYQIISPKLLQKNSKGENISVSDDKTYFLLNNYINNKIIDLIHEIGIETSKAYGKQLVEVKND